MAGNDTAALVVALSAQVTKFERDMQKAGSIADRQVSSIEDRFSQLNPTFSGLTALIPAALVTGAIATIKGVVDALAEIGDKSQDMRIPAQELQALSMGAQQARISADELNKALTTFTDVSKKSTDDGKDFYKALQNISGSFVEAFKNAPSQSERLRILSQAMGSTTDEVKRAQLGLTAFGSDSERVTGYIASLAGSMDDLIQRAKDLGISIDDAMVKQAQLASTQLGTLAQVVKAELTTAIASLIPTIIELLPYLEKIGAAVRDSIASFVSPGARPTATLEAEIEDSIAAVKRLQKEQADLQKQGQSNSESILSPFLTDNKAQVAAIQEKIDKEKEFQALRNKILDSRQDAEDGKPAAKPEPAFKPRPTLNPKKEDGQDSFDRTEEQITRHTASMNADTIAVFQNNAAQAQLRAEFQLLNAIRKDEGEVTQAQIDQYQKLRASMSAEQALKEAAINLTPAHKASFIAAAEGARVATENYDKARESLNRINAASAQVGSALSSAFADAIVEGKSLNDVMSSLLKSLAKMAINSSLMSLFGAPSSGGLSPFASFLGIGRNAEGTDNWRGGPTWVGEKGPEIINLPRGSQVIPNNVATASSGGVNAPVSISIDARGADPAVEARLNAQIAGLKASLPSVIVQTVKTAKQGRTL